MCIVNTDTSVVHVLCFDKIPFRKVICIYTYKQNIRKKLFTSVRYTSSNLTPGGSTYSKRITRYYYMLV